MLGLAWWAIFLVPTLVAIGWATWQARPKDSIDPLQSVDAHHRFVNALSRLEQAKLFDDSKEDRH